MLVYFPPGTVLRQIGVITMMPRASQSRESQGEGTDLLAACEGQRAVRLDLLWVLVVDRHHARRDAIARFVLPDQLV